MKAPPVFRALDLLGQDPDDPRRRAEELHQDRARSAKLTKVMKPSRVFVGPLAKLNREWGDINTKSRHGCGRKIVKKSVRLPWIT
jgi:hypothetical protein